MDHRAEIRYFLRTRRARITPEQANLFAYGGHRRVPGLRREEVAMIAGVSVDYYARLERGNLSGVSDEVLGAIARALQLDEAETTHLFDLARAARATTSPRRRAAAVQQVRPSVQRLLDGWTGVPAWVRNERMDILATNQLGRALYSEVFADPGAAGQQRPVRVPRSAVAGALSRLGAGRQRHRGDASLVSRPQSV